MAFLKGFSTIGESTVSNHVKQNLISFFDYGLLEKGNFVNVDVPETGLYGGDKSELILVDDPDYTSGQVWQGIRGNWVWESGVGAYASESDANPGVSGVYVDSVFYPVTSSGDYSHGINHQLGRVVFDSAISTASTVQCAHSYKYINVEQCDGLAWFKRIHKQSEKADSTTDQEWNILKQNRIQLPAIGVEISSPRSMSPYGLGGKQWVTTAFLFNCIAEDVYTRDMLVDIVCMQKEKSIVGYNLENIDSNDAYPVNYLGVPVSGALTYPNLVTTYPGSKIYIKNISLDSLYSISSDVHVGTVKIITESILFGV
jgi:hypothetical protein